MSVNKDNAAENAAVLPPAAIMSFTSEESIDLKKLIIIFALNLVRLLHKYLAINLIGDRRDLILGSS